MPIYPDPVGLIEDIPQQPLESKLSSICSDLISEDGISIRGIVGGNQSNETLLVDIYINNSTAFNRTLLEPHVREFKVESPLVIEADVYKNSMIPISELPFVAYIDIPMIHRANALELIDTSELQKAVNVYELRNHLNLTGDHVTIAVVDGQFYSNNIIRMSLPANLILLSNKQYSDDDIHGTACSEIIAQIAPGVTMYQVDTGDGSPLQFIKALNQLQSTVEHVDIVSSSIDYPVGPEIFGHHGEIAGAVEGLIRNGTIWVNAAGNEADKHWCGRFQDPDGDGVNNFQGDDETINLSMNIPPGRGTFLEVYLAWNDWVDPLYGRSTQDYNLFIVSPDGKKAQSIDRQQGGMFHRPVEKAAMPVKDSGIYQILVKRNNASRNDAFFHLIANFRLDEYAVKGSSVGVIACIEDVVSVGAFNLTSLSIEPYSSRGPNGEGQVKPDLVAPTNLRTLSTPHGVFDGTSAATPVVSGCLALAVEKLKRDGGDESQILPILTILKSSAADLGTGGPDNDYGYGLINMGFLE